MENASENPEIKKSWAIQMVSFKMRASSLSALFHRAKAIYNRENKMFLRVLGYKEDGQWVAHCLEVDIIGTGHSYEVAKEDMIEALKAQYSFAQSKNDPGLMWHPAAHYYFVAWEKALAERMKSLNWTTSFNHEPIQEYIPSPALDVAPHGFTLARA